MTTAPSGFPSGIIVLYPLAWLPPEVGQSESIGTWLAKKDLKAKSKHSLLCGQGIFRYLDIMPNRNNKTALARFETLHSSNKDNGYRRITLSCDNLHSLIAANSAIEITDTGIKLAEILQSKYTHPKVV